MYVKQIISVHPRSSCTIFCAKCGTALLKIRPFEGFAPQLYPENPKMRYSSTQASRISLRSGLPHLPPPHLPHLSPPRLPRFLPPSHHLRLPPAVHRACDSAEREGNRRRTENRRRNGKPAGKRRNRRRTEKRRGNGGKRKTGGEQAGKRRKNGKPEKNGETEEPAKNRRRTGGETEGKGGKGGETEGEGGSYQQAGMCELH